jgi:hypothetical protein
MTSKMITTERRQGQRQVILVNFLVKRRNRRFVFCWFFGKNGGKIGFDQHGKE